jgi:hypothetical protein
MMPMQPPAVHTSSAAQHSHVKRHAVVPGVHTRGSQVPSTHASQSPQLGTHALGSHS